MSAVGDGRTSRSPPEKPRPFLPDRCTPGGTTATKRWSPMGTPNPRAIWIAICRRLRRHQQRASRAAAALLHGAGDLAASPDSSRGRDAAPDSGDRDSFDRSGGNPARSVSGDRLARFGGQVPGRAVRGGPSTGGGVDPDESQGLTVHFESRRCPRPSGRLERSSA
jgi:hypothetical protein